MAGNFVITPVLRQLLDNLKRAQFENNVAYMYVDTVGENTVGVGHNLTAHGDALKLPFIVKRFERHAVIGGDVGVPISSDKVIGRRASIAEIQNDFDFLKKHSGLGKYSPEHLQKYTTLELPSADIDQLFTKDLDVAVAVCRREFGEAFDKFPTTCQAALIDIAFNCGTFASFQSRLVPAIKGTGAYAKKTPSERWKIASESCRRGEVSEVRNALVAKWFMDGATPTLRR
jgi:GH24 family phage-related lysozyme (muramidase)